MLAEKMKESFKLAVWKSLVIFLDRVRDKPFAIKVVNMSYPYFKLFTVKGTLARVLVWACLGMMIGLGLGVVMGKVLS